MKNLKKSISDLAIAGGVPAFSEPKNVGAPNLGDRKRLLERLEGALDRRWLSNSGPLVVEFETALKEIIGAKHVIPIVNGTVALELAIQAMGLHGEVIVPSYTFIATAHALQWQHITPVFCDIDPNTHCIDARRIEELITPRTTGIIAVHLWGRPCEIEKIEAIASKNGLKVLYDAAHAFNVSSGGKKIGRFGDAEVFSFHATKFINSLEGGAVATNSDTLAEKIRLMSNFGFRGPDDVKYVGTNGKMNEFSAAMGLTVLESLDEIVRTNRRNYEAYKRGLSSICEITLVDYSNIESANYQYVVLEVDENASGITRDEVVSVLHAENIMARRYFYPGCHRTEPYRDSNTYSGQTLSHTDAVARRVIVMPTGSHIDEADIGKICSILRLTVSGSAQLREHFREQMSQLRQ